MSFVARLVVACLAAAVFVSAAPAPRVVAVGDVHGEVFGEIRPSIVILAVAGLAAPGLKVEIEADALI